MQEPEPEPAPIPSSTPQVSRMPGKAAPVPTAQHQPVQVDDDALNLAMHINQRNQPTGALNRAMLTPDRLDGHGNAPSRAPQRETIHPYFVDEDP